MSDTPTPTVPPGDSRPSPEQIDRAIAEVKSLQPSFTPKTYTIILAALETQQQLTIEVAPDDEIRLVTVMFLDVMDSTAIAERIKYEQWRLLIGEAHRRFAETVNKWGGEIGQYLGDGLMCFFGARRSQGNDAARAVACALEMQETAASFHEDAITQYGVDDFQVRLGISTGRVVVGTIGIEEKSETLALGTTTVRAARLQTICPPGKVLVDDETQRRVRDAFELTTQPPVQLKGFTEPVANYLVVGEREQIDRTRADNRIENITIPFVGRETVLGEVATHLQSTGQNIPSHMLLISGDTGMGKSRILQEAAISPQAQRYCRVWMFAHYERRHADYSLVRDMLAALLKLPSGITTEAAEAQITNYTTTHWEDPQAEAAAAIVGSLGGYGFQDSVFVRTLDRSTPDENRVQRHEWVRRWLRGIAGEQPLLLLVDNLQWADPVSLDLLRYLLKHERNCLVLGAARPEFEIDAGIYLNRSNLTTSTLSPLSEAHTRWIINAVLVYVKQVPEDLVETIVDRAEGNPLFVEEFLRMLFDIGVFRPGDAGDGWRMDPIQYYEMRDNDHLPNGLLGVFQARLDDLPHTERRVIQAAAVVGQTFWEGAVSAILTMDAEPWLDALVGRHIITRRLESRFDGTVEYTFHNSLYHDVAYAMLPLAVRMTYHQQVAGWMAIVATRHPQALGLLASHQNRAGNRLEALEAYVAATSYNLEQGQLSEVQRLFDEAIKVSGGLVQEELDEARPYMSTLWILQAEKAYSQRNYAEATAASEAALNMLKQLPAGEYLRERLRASVTLGNAYTSLGDYEAALDALTGGYQDVSDEQDPAQRSTVLRAFAGLFWVRGNLEEATLYGQRALADAQASGNDRELAATQAVLGRIWADQGKLEESLAIFEAIARLNQRENNLLYQVDDLLMIADIYYHLFAYDMALGMLQRAEELCKRINYQTPLLDLIRGEIQVAKGNHDQGVADLNAAFSSEHQNTHTRHLLYLGYLRGLVQAQKPDEAVQEGGQFIREIQSHSPLLHGRAQLWLGMAQHQLGRSAAVDSLWSALTRETTHGGRDLWLCHYALSIVLDEPRTANEHRQTAYKLLSQRATTIRHHMELYAIARNPAQADAIFDRWQADAGTA